MAGKKENIKALFANTRSRVIILFTVILLLVVTTVGIMKFVGSTSSPFVSAADVRRTPVGIQSIPGALNQTAQYASLQEEQNLEQAQTASTKGGSAIPTIIRSQVFGEGVEPVGAAAGQGGLGFQALAREDLAGAQKSLWVQALQDSNCAKASLAKAINQGANLIDLKSACSCVQLKNNGYKLADLMVVCKCNELKAAGYNIYQMKGAGFTAAQLRACGYVACEEHGVGFSAQEMKNAGYSDGELKGAGFSDADIARAGGLPDGYTAEDVRKAGCDVVALTRLRSAGVTAAAIRRISGCSADKLKAAGFSAQDLKNAGFSAADLKNAGFSAAQLRDAGFGPRDLLNAGFTSGDLADAGFAATEIRAAELVLPPGMTADAVKEAGCSVEALKRQRLAGVSAALIHKLAGCSPQALKAAGFTTSDLLNAGFTAAQLKAGLPVLGDSSISAAGCDPVKLRQLLAQGVSAKRIHELNGCSADALKSAGFDAKDLLDAGFTPQQLAAAGFTPNQIRSAQSMNDGAIQAAGCDPIKLKALLVQGVSAKRIHALNGCSAEALKNAGFDAKDLIDAGFTTQQLAAAGFTPNQIRSAQSMNDGAIQAAGCDPIKLKALLVQGVSAKRIHALNGCSAEALKNAGFDAKDLLDAGFTTQQLAAAGFSPNQIRSAQSMNDGAIHAAGCDPIKLKALLVQGVSARRIHALNGCSAQALKNAGFDAKDLLDAGFMPQQLAAAGFTAAQLRAAQSMSDNLIRASGCDPAKLKMLLIQGVSAKRIHELNGCDAQALKNAGFDAKALADAGFTPQQLLAAGFTAAEVQATQPPEDKTIRAAGCDPAKLNGLMLRGVSAKRIHDMNGCSAAALKKAGFDVKELADAGFTPQQLLAAGFTPEDISTTQPVDDNMVRTAGCDPTKLSALMGRGVSAKRIYDLNGCSAAALKAAGFSANELLDAGFTPQQLLAVGFKPEEMRVIASSASSVDDNKVRKAGCDPTKLKQLAAQGATAQQIHTLNGCSLDVLKAAGFDAKSLADAGFTPAQLLAAGFTPAQLIHAGLSPAGVIAAGRTADCSVASLQAARALGVSAATLKKTLGCSAEAMKNAGFTPLELKNAGFTAAELKNAGFSAGDLNSAGFSAKELRAVGYSAKQLRDAGYNAQQLNDAGFSATDLKDAGFSAAQLKAAGLSAAALKSAGFSAAELMKAGLSTSDLKAAGFTADQLKKAGLSDKELQAAGFSSQESALAGLAAVDTQPAVPSIVTTIPSIDGTVPGKSGADVANAKQLQAILNKQQTQAAEQRYQQKIQQRSSVMTAAANQAMQGWKSVPAQQYVATSVKEKNVAAGGANAQGGYGLAQNSLAGGGDLANGKESVAIVRTGDVLFAVIDTSINSDEPGPILATIVSGKLKGAKLIGSFNLPSNADQMVISFNTLSIPGAAKTVSISAYAIDPNTARTALSSQTDHHYLMRYGSLFAATFLEGFGNAFQSANTTITVGGTGGTSNTTVSNGIGRSTLENAVIGLATLGKAWGQVAMQQMSRPTTVEVFSGTGVGVLFTQDLRAV